MTRKTLDDIRREIDAEFVPSEGEAGADDDDTRALEALRVRERRHRRYPYLKIALLCTVVVEVFILGYVAGRYYRDDPLGSLFGAQTAVLTGSAPPAASVMAAQPSTSVAPASSSPMVAASSTAAVERAIDVAQPERVVAPRVAIEEPPTTMAVPHAPMPPREATLVRPDSKIVAPETTPGAPALQRVAPRAKLVTPGVTAVRPEATVATPEAKLVTLAVPGPGDWVESQSQLRTALREWLRLSGHAGPNSESENAEVILNADGQTAKTRVPVRVGNHIIIREQRWRRDARGWNVVEEHQVQSPRPR